MLRKQEEARERFAELQAEKKAKAEGSNPSVKAYMGLMAEAEKDRKAQEKVNALNPIISNLDPKTP